MLSTRSAPIKVDPDQLELRILYPDNVTTEYVSWLNDDDTNRFLEVRHLAPLTISDVKKFVTDCLENQRHHWGIFLSDRHVGNVSCSAYSHKYRWVDISNLIGEKTIQHSNVAKIALANALDYLFARGFHRISAGTYANHFSGIALLTNLGFKREGTLRDAAMVDHRFEDVAKYAILEDEWKSTEKRFPRIRVQSPPWES